MRQVFDQRFELLHLTFGLQVVLFGVGEADFDLVAAAQVVGVEFVASAHHVEQVAPRQVNGLLAGLDDRAVDEAPVE